MPYVILIFLFIVSAIALFFLMVTFFLCMSNKEPNAALVRLLFFVILGGLFVTPGAYWMYYSYRDIEIAEEHFCKIFIDDTLSGGEVQCIRVGDKIYNLNKELGCVIGESSIARAYRLEEWKYGILWANMGKLGTYQFELIYPGHKRYTEAKNAIMSKE